MSTFDDAEIERLPPGVMVPKNEAEAEAMQKLGYAWLAEHSPHRLTDQAREIERLRAALAEYVCECKGQCQAEIYGGSCGRRAYAELKGGEA